jgi:hypothetical protein
MILIWGWRSLLRVLGTGDFYCPRCQQDSSYKLVRPRRWFTLFFIPVIPLKWGEQYVECTRCGGAFREAVLHVPTTAQFSNLLNLAARAVYARTIAVAFRNNEDMVERAVASLSQFTEPGYNSANVLADVEQLGGRPLSEFLAPVATNMGLQGRENFLARLVEFASVDGQISPAAHEVLAEAAQELQISAAHLAGIVSTTAPAEADRPESA